MMCDQMGIEPKEEDIPIDPSELSYNSQVALMLYQILPDKIEGMNGIWLGKEYAGLLDIMNIYEISNKREVFELLQVCISEAHKHYDKQHKTQESINK